MNKFVLLRKLFAQLGIFMYYAFSRIIQYTYKSK